VARCGVAQTQIEQKTINADKNRYWASRQLLLAGRSRAFIPMIYHCYWMYRLNGGNPDSHTPAHESATTVAPFRAWRISLPIIAEGPPGLPKRLNWLCPASTGSILRESLDGCKQCREIEWQRMKRAPVRVHFSDKRVPEMSGFQHADYQSVWASIINRGYTLDNWKL
tara:strand:+ start:159 stop:662 length:504 start_codon:yes stop_codon:yes gene_type:complete